MRNVGIIAIVASIVGLALAGTAAAETLKLHGQIVGQPKSKAQITVIRNSNRNLKAVKKIKFTKVAATCDDGTGGAISGSDRGRSRSAARTSPARPGCAGSGSTRATSRRAASFAAAARP